MKKLSLTCLGLLTLTFMLSVSASVAAQSQNPGDKEATFNLASYNIRYYNEKDSLNGNSWQGRSPWIAALVKYHGFDIFGTQEGLYFQLESLKKLLPGFDYIGVGRDDGGKKGEFAAIFYNTNLFDILDSGTFWLSQTPEKPSVGWDAALPRVCTWGKFMHKPSGKQFFYFNLHMDHIGLLARDESSKLILKMLPELNPEGLPAIVSGDFNVDQHSPCYLLLADSGILGDSFQKAKLTYAPAGTYNGWKNNAYSPDRIDHIFVTSDVTVNKYGILTDTYRTEVSTEENGATKDTDTDKGKTKARIPSDHFPVCISVTLGSQD